MFIFFAFFSQFRSISAKLGQYEHTSSMFVFGRKVYSSHSVAFHFPKNDKKSRFFFDEIFTEDYCISEK